MFASGKEFRITTFTIFVSLVMGPIQAFVQGLYHWAASQSCLAFLFFLVLLSRNSVSMKIVPSQKEKAMWPKKISGVCEENDRLRKL